MFSITTDRTGFPLVHLSVLQLDVHLWPITKLQFEAYLAETQALGDQQYAELLELNPRGCLKSCFEDAPERALLTGILPDEAVAFAKWLGKDFRVPTTSQWQAIWSRFSRRDTRRMNLEEVLNVADHATVKWLQAMLKPGRDASMFRWLSQVGRMERGAMEWVTGKRGWQLLGEPREAFAEQLFSWRQPVTPIDRSKRNRLFGFRLVRMRNG